MSASAERLMEEEKLADASFTYPAEDSQAVLKDFSMEFRKGKRLP